jgi:hypothetical protein
VNSERHSNGTSESGQIEVPLPGYPKNGKKRYVFRESNMAKPGFDGFRCPSRSQESAVSAEVDWRLRGCFFKMCRDSQSEYAGFHSDDGFDCCLKIPGMHAAPGLSRP